MQPRQWITSIATSGLWRLDTHSLIAFVELRRLSAGSDAARFSSNGPGSLAVNGGGGGRRFAEFHSRAIARLESRSVRAWHAADPGRAIPN